MSGRRLKLGFLVLEGLNAFATAYYFNYLFFYLQKHLGFGNLGNLVFSALNGFLYVFAAIYGGRFAQRRGYFLALNLGFAGMAAALCLGLFLSTAAGQLLVMLIWTLAICFTWPTLEAVVSEGEDRRGLARIVGIYNMVWAGGAALAFFTGGALVQLLGWKSIFWLPGALHLAQWALALWLEKEHGPVIREPGAPEAAEVEGLSSMGRAERRLIAARFLRLAWVANPLAYVAINTALPLMPDIARKLRLSPMLAGFVCSAWMFARLGAFVLLWRWTAWHYRLRWLFSSYVLLIASFAALLLAPYVWAVVLAELVFGWAIGLIYYSSLFYSMDASETKGVHGGVHEAAIGMGICTGPAIGAAALAFFPQQPSASAWGVSALLVIGLGALGVLGRRGASEPRSVKNRVTL